MEVNNNKINYEITNRFWHLFTLYRKYSMHISKNLDDADLIHDYRVTIRRILSLLELLQEMNPNLELESLRKAIKKVFKKFNNIRDFQVQIELARNLNINELYSISYFIFLQKKKKADERKLWKLIAKGTLTHLEGSLFFAYINFKNFNSSFSFSELKFEKFIKYGRELYTNLLSQCSTIQKNNYSSYHPVRLALKKFRYSMEIFQTILNFPPEKLKDLQSMQNTLGNIQDLCVFQNLINEYLLSIDLKAREIPNLIDNINFRLKTLEEEFEQNLIKLNFWDLYFK
ncbi:MAG: CHAD domain-containing protein [Candidatus Kapaibacteriales bacterium]